jgi:hypothetical protein
MVNAVVHLRHLQSTMAGMFASLAIIRATEGTDGDRPRHTGILCFQAASSP